MSASESQARHVKALSLIAVAAAIVVALIAVDGRSLWTDEFGSWDLAVKPSWSAWLSSVRYYPNSDGQLIFYHFYMHLWVKAFGASEIVLRWSNIPWLLAALLALTRLRLPSAVRVAAILVYAVSAFVWYYVNDTRPYVVYLCGATIFTIGLLNAMLAAPERADRETFLFIAVGAVVLVGGSVLGVLWLAACLLSIAILDFRSLKAILAAAVRYWIVTAVAVLAGGVIVGFAAQSFIGGARASQVTPFSIMALGYGWIEAVGAAGFGPGRADLRANALSHLEQVLPMAALALLATYVWLRGLMLFPNRRAAYVLVAAVVIHLATMTLVGKALHWQVVGRHISAIIPTLYIGMAVYLAHIFGTRARTQLVVATILLAALFTSALMIHFAYRHKNDDYVTAIAWAKSNLDRNRTVLWIADGRALTYYKEQLGSKGEDGGALLTVATYPLRKKEILYPDVVIESPRGGVDPRGEATIVLKDGAYRLVDTAPVFNLYERAQ